MHAAYDTAIRHLMHFRRVSSYGDIVRPAATTTGGCAVYFVFRTFRLFQILETIIVRPGRVVLHAMACAGIATTEFCHPPVRGNFGVWITDRIRNSIASKARNESKPRPLSTASLALRRLILTVLPYIVRTLAAFVSAIEPIPSFALPPQAPLGSQC